MSRSRVVNLANLQQFTAINLLVDPGHIGGPVIVPSCAQFVLNWTLTDGRTGHNVLYGRYSGAFAMTSATAQAFYAALIAGTNWSTLAGFLAPTGLLSSVSIRDVNSAGNPLILSTGAATPGTSAGTALPDEVAAVITLRTARTGPQNRGRVFVPNWATNALGAGNVIAAAAVTALQNWANGPLASAFPAAGVVHVIGQPARAAYTGSTGTAHPARAATSIPVNGYVVRDNHWDSTRKRGLK